jgi:hypothetical protein
MEVADRNGAKQPPTNWALNLNSMGNPVIGYLLQPAAAAQFDIEFKIGENSGDAHSSMGQREVDRKSLRSEGRPHRRCQTHIRRYLQT